MNCRSRDPLRLVRILAPAVATLLLAPGALAQAGDPRQEIQEIAERVADQLQEIDRLLLESSHAQQQRNKPVALLEQSMQLRAEAGAGIEQLIDKLSNLKGT